MFSPDREQTPHARQRRGGFTLIELLIVVAIIAILAAIAVPNFLEAQVRSKVSRAKTDMRTIGVAIEAYSVDNNTYVNDSDNTPGKNGQDGLLRLTTPIAYITTLPRDPFQQQMAETDDDAAVFYELGSGADHNGWGASYGAQGSERKVQSWLLISVGTNVSPKNTADDTLNNDEWPWGKNAGNPVSCTPYDPTNGTVSVGDLYRVGGALGEGTYLVNTVERGRFPD